MRPTAGNLQAALGLGEPFHDPEVGAFGLENSVWSLGDTFIEIVAPVREGTTAGRYLDKRGGDGGYMAIFQVPDTPAARARAEALGVRTVWQADLHDISGTHFHPKDVPGAIVSVDTPRPAASWRWAGPAWAGSAAVPDHGPGGILGITVECADPLAAAATWAALLGVDAEGARVVIDGGRQSIRFQPRGEHGDGIVEVTVAAAGAVGRVRVCGVTFNVEPALRSGRVAVTFPE
jgi:hypothetical protein